MSRSTVMDVRIGRATMEVRVTASRLAVVARSRRWFVVERPIERRAANCRQPWKGLAAVPLKSRMVVIAHRWVSLESEFSRCTVVLACCRLFHWIYRRSRLPSATPRDGHARCGRNNVPRGTLHTACLCSFVRYCREPPGTLNCVFKFGDDAARRRSPLLGLEPRPAIACRCCCRPATGGRNQRDLDVADPRSSAR